MTAINNIDNGFYNLKRWWYKKYNIPPKSLNDYSVEELYIEMLEDYYDENPKNKQKFLSGFFIDEAEEEKNIIEKYNSKNNGEIDEKTKELLKQFQSDKVLSEKEEKKIIDNLGKGLSGSYQENEFEEEF